MVANSPGLIAGSYVLHRLLVPRHPPIALSSLSHNNKLQRCSRPLYSSQNTGRKTDPDSPLPSNNTPPGKTHPSGHHHQEFGESRPQPHTHTRNPIKDPGAVVTQKNQSNLFYQDGPIPQDPTARLGPSLTPHPRSTPHPRRESAVLARIRKDPDLMVNVPHSEAPPPRNGRPGNDE